MLILRHTYLERFESNAIFLKRENKSLTYLPQVITAESMKMSQDLMIFPPLNNLLARFRGVAEKESIRQSNSFFRS